MQYWPRTHRIHPVHPEDVTPDELRLIAAIRERRMVPVPNSSAPTKAMAGAWFRHMPDSGPMPMHAMAAMLDAEWRATRAHGDVYAILYD